MSVKEISWRGFQDGVNSRDYVSELGEHELVGASNVTVDERGGLQKRLGFQNRYGGHIGAGLAKNVYYWASQNKVVKQIGTGIHVDGGASIKTFSTSDRVGFAEFGGALYMIHPIDKLFKVTAALAVSGPIANSHKGSCLAVWQNALFSGGDPDNKDRLTWSATGDADTWPASPNSNLIRDKDSEIITALGGADGSDISGRPGLLVFKEASTYRVHTLSGGLYNTIDVNAGASSNIAVVSAFGRTYAINTKGIFSTDGNGPMREESGRIENFFSEGQINQSLGSLYCAGRYQDRLFFSIPRAGNTWNDLELEYHPLQGWIMPHEKYGGVACYAYFGQGVSTQVVGSANEEGVFHNSHRTGADNGEEISSFVQLRWIDPSGGNLSRIRRLRFVGLTSGAAHLNVEPHIDYEETGSLPSLTGLDLTSSAAEYDDPAVLYDTDDLYGPINLQSKDDRHSIGVCYAISLKLSETSDLSSLGRNILDGTQPEQGAWTLSAVHMTAIDLGTL